MVCLSEFTPACLAGWVSFLLVGLAVVALAVLILVPSVRDTVVQLVDIVGTVLKTLLGRAPDAERSRRLQHARKRKTPPDA